MREAWLIVYRECPHCKALLQKAKQIDRARKCVPLKVVEIETIPWSLRIQLFGYVLTDYGLQLNVVTPYLAVVENNGDKINVLWGILLRGPFYTEADIRYILMATKAFCESGKTVSETSEGGGGKRGRRRKRESEGDATEAT